MCLRSGRCRLLRVSAGCLLTTSFLSTASAAAAEFYVAPAGNAANNGTIHRPLDLATALSRNSPAHPGDTIWLRGGTYNGTFTSYLEGTPSAPITVRPYRDERVTLDGVGSSKVVLEVFGHSVIFRGFEITNSAPGRLSNQNGPWPNDLPRGHGIFSWGPNMKFVNLVLHDLQSGIGLWTESVGSEVYGCIIYHNGWQAPDGSHGHGIYTQNRTGTRLVRDNIVFNQFSHGIHAYGSDSAFLDNITLEGNVVFNNGILGSSGLERDLLLGGGRVAQNPVLESNYTYGGGQSNLGYAAGCVNGKVLNNYLVGSTPLILNHCQPVLKDNVFYGAYAGQYGWQSLPVVAGNTYYTQAPPNVVVRVRPNLYEPGRANIIIYNWPRHGQVQIDLSASGLAPGDSFELRDAQNFFGPLIASGTYTGATVALSMTGLQLAAPVGNVPVVPAHTAPQFAAIVLVPHATAATLSATFSVTPTSIAAGGSATLSWSTVTASQVSIDSIGPVDPNGSVTVGPQRTTTYTLTASGAGGTKVTRTATVTVQPNATAPTPVPSTPAAPVTPTTPSAPAAPTSPTAPTQPAAPTAPGGTSQNRPAVGYLISPADGSSHGASQTLRLELIATDFDGTVKGAQFFDGTTLIRRLTAPPFVVAWTPGSTGTHVLSVKMTDDKGAESTTPAVKVTIR